MLELQKLAPLAALALTVGACASGANVEPPARPTRSRNVLTAAELAGLPYDNAYDAIRRLRPTWLQRRAGGQAAYPVLFIQDNRVGELDQLRSIPLQDVAEIRFINARDATTRWGTGYRGGVIQVIWK
ncbi:MAG: hypothetical protein ACE5PT_10795 [Gemmatimonadales bacterium]